MKDFPGTVIPSKRKKGHWTYTLRRGTLEENTIIVAEDEDPTKVYDRAVIAKSRMREACGKKKEFIGNRHGLPR